MRKSEKRIASLLEKRIPQAYRLRADFVGFDIPDRYVAGFSLDEDERYRDIDHLVVLSK